MSEPSNEDRPLAKWTTANLFILVSFVFTIVVAWFGLSERITKVEVNDNNQSASINEIKRDVRSANMKIDQLLMAEGIRPTEPPDNRDENQN